MKLKDQVPQKVKNYIAHLCVQGRQPHALCVDCRTEFINADLQSTYSIQGIEIQMTAPYSPSQNGVVEWMNCTLVKLMHAMLYAAALPEFLWEPMVEHTAYLQN